MSVALYADLVLDSMVASGQLDPFYRDKVQDTLLTRHLHQHQRHMKRDGKGLPMIRSLADIGRKMSARTLSEAAAKGIQSAHIDLGPNSTTSICCGFVVDLRFDMDLSYNVCAPCCTTNP